jgi:GTP-binding protein HflX
VSSKDDEFYYNRDTKKPPKLFVVQPRVRPENVLQAKLLEALKLADSLEEQREEGDHSENDEMKQPPYLVVQNPGTRSAKSHADTYFGPGTVETVKAHVDAIDTEDELDAVFVNAILSGIQQRNLEKAWGKRVYDRVGLIIEIFNAHAQSKEAKLQAELAALMYKKTRLVRVRGPDGRLTFGADGEAEVVSGRGRASGGRGFISGAGETEIQLQRRRILERRIQLLSEIEEVRRTRALQRAARKRHGCGHGCGLPIVAVVGYTNAGKSSLVAALSQSDLYIDDKLFATLDPRLRNIFLPSGHKALLSDTVGFISDLPIQLVEAFHATLEEVTEADLLMHVIDSSSLNAEEQRRSVLGVLEQIGVSSKKLENMIEVWNKVDLLQCNPENVLPVESHECEKQEPCVNEISFEVSPEELSLKDRDAGEESCNGARLSTVEIEDMVISDISVESGKVNWSSNNIACVKTSATTGIGLQELLHLLDEKLKPTVDSENKYFVKWRPS